MNDNIVGNVAPKDKNRFRGFTKNGNDLYFSYLNENNEVAYCLLKGSDIKELMRIPNESSFIIDCICGTSVYVNYYDHGDFCLGVMNINDLDQNKTEQSIANERARLDTCRVTLERLKQERDRVQNQQKSNNNTYRSSYYCHSDSDSFSYSFRCESRERNFREQYAI